MRTSRLRTGTASTRSNHTAVGELRREAVTPRRGTGEQVGLLGGGGTLYNKIAGIPEDRITVGDFVDRKVALKHRARRPEGLNTSLNVGAKSSVHHLGRRRFGLLVEAQASVALT